MKKTILLAALVAFAGSTYAASLNWNITNVSNDGGTTKLSDCVAYLFITQQSQNFGAGTTTVDAVKSLIETAGTEVVTDGSGKATALKNGTTTIDIAAEGKTNAAGGISGGTGYNGNGFDNGNSLTAFAVIFDAADFASAANYIVTDERSASWTSSTGSKMLGFGTQVNKTWSPTSVPEPATATLALAGLALLLKRRRA